MSIAKEYFKQYREAVPTSNWEAIKQLDDCVLEYAKGLEEASIQLERMLNDGDITKEYFDNEIARYGTLFTNLVNLIVSQLHELGTQKPTLGKKIKAEVKSLVDNIRTQIKIASAKRIIKSANKNMKNLNTQADQNNL